jgi:hypothetical protein
MYLIVARQQLCKNVTAATNKHATTEELLDIVFCAVRFLSRKADHSFFPEFLSQIKESRLLLLAVPARTAQRKVFPFLL